MNKILLIAIFSASLWHTPASAAPDTTRVMAKMRERLTQIIDFSADVRQSFFWKVLNKHQEMEGTLRMKRPEKFYISFKDVVMVSNGTSVWRYTPETKQVLKSAVAAAPEIPSLSDLIFDFEKSYRIERVEETKNKFLILQLLPQREMPNVKDLRVWVDTRDWIIKELRYLDDSENETIYQLRNIKINQALKDGLFDYQVPKGAEVFETQ
jgi:outer membrane lipoprotein carrier protein